MDFPVLVGCSIGMRKSGQLKTPYSEGTMHVIFDPLDFIAKLAALAPKPRMNPGSSPGQALGAMLEACVQY
jgi:hypothetical protein